MNKQRKIRCCKCESAFLSIAPKNSCIVCPTCGKQLRIGRARSSGQDDSKKEEDALRFAVLLGLVGFMLVGGVIGITPWWYTSLIGEPARTVSSVGNLGWLVLLFACMCLFVFLFAFPLRRR